MSSITKDINVAYYEALIGRVEATRQGDMPQAEKFEKMRVKLGDILVSVQRLEKECERY